MNENNTKPYKQTPETIKIILEAIADGLTQRDASRLAGISEDTLCLWKRNNSDLSEQMRQKEVEYKRKLLKTIEKAADKSWNAAAWLLERKYKKEFSLNTRLEQDPIPDFPAFSFDMDRLADRVIEKL